MDIPQLKKTHYQVNVFLDGIEDSLAHYAESQEKSGYKFELNPDFQRGHVWTEAQQIKYIEWLVAGGESGRDIIFNHPGWMHTFKGDMVCVDGLQRLTACLRFIHGEIKAFGYSYAELEAAHKLHDITLIFKIGAYNRKELLEWYLQLNSGGTVHTQTELDKVRQLLLLEGS